MRSWFSYHSIEGHLVTSPMSQFKKKTFSVCQRISFIYIKSSSEDSKWKFKKFLSFITNIHIEIRDHVEKLRS